MTRFRLFFFLIPLLTLSACGLFPEQEDETRNWSAQKLYSEASEAMAEGDYQTAIKYYELLEASYPFGKYAMQAQLGVAYAYYKAEEHDSAIAAAERFIKMHPRNPHVDYAYYLRGLVNFHRSMGFIERFLPVDSAQRDPASAMIAYTDFATLVEKFPASEYAADARKRLIYLRNNLAEHELHVARYYFKRGAYLAAVNRCKAVLANYSRTPAARKALEMMIEGYQRLDMPELAQDTRRVLELNLAQGNFASEPEEGPEEASLSRKVWEYLKLDVD